MSANLSIETEALPPEWIARLVDDIPTGVAVFDRELRYVAANAPWIAAFRLSSLPLAGQRHDQLDATDGARLAELQRRALAGEAASGSASVESDASGRFQHRAIEFRPRRARDGSILGIIGALHASDAAPSNSEAADTPDRLTGIAGREAFLTRVRGALGYGQAPCHDTAVFLFDIDDFRGINDHFGTAIGDLVLKTIAGRLRTALRARATPASHADRPYVGPSADLVARIGADEFAVVLGGEAPALADAEGLAARLMRSATEPVIVGDRRIRITASVGYMITGPGHHTEDDVLRDLNVALQEAKSRGPNSIKPWEPGLTHAPSRRLALLDELRRALDDGEFVLHYQPILNLRDRRVVGAEALLRWNHPRDGLMSPAEFLPLLEESGMIVPVGCWVIREVARQMRVWRMLYGRDMLDWISINVSPRQFNDPSLLLAALAEIDEGGFPLTRLKLEITESAIMRSPEVTRSVLSQMKEIGIRVALDDFGTGYSALGALRHYSVDTIKLDRDFTARLDTSEGQELVLALLTIARIYGAEVVAEGIEVAAQCDFLRRSNCDLGQGYLFAKPMDGSSFGAYALTHLVTGPQRIRPLVLAEPA
jgi:diguanylate cyclase